MTVYTTIPNVPPTFLDDNGLPISGGKLFSYLSGTTTKQDTYNGADSTTAVANPNPIILDSASRATIFLPPGSSYKFVLAPSTDTDPPSSPYWTRDGIQSVPSTNVDLEVTGTAGENISANDVVVLSDGSYGKTAGRWYKADADFEFLSSLAKQVGMAPSAILSGFSGAILLKGRITGLTSLSIGTFYYASATAGALTSTAPGNAAQVGVADSTTSLIVGYVDTQEEPYTTNFVANGEFLIWPTSSLPAYFTVDGTAPTVTRDTGASFQKRQGWSMKLIGGAGQGRMRYSALVAADWNNGWRGSRINVGCWLYATAASSIRIYIDGVGAAGPQFSAYHSGGSSWEWITFSYLLPSDATAMYCGVAIENGKTGYAWGLTGTLFGKAPSDFVSCPSKRGFLYFPQTGDATVDATYDVGNVELTKPALVLGCKAIAGTAPVTTSYTWNIGKLTTAPATYTPLYTSDLAMTTTKKRGDATNYAPTAGAWDARCFNGNVTPGDTLIANTVLGKKVTAVGTTAAVDAKIIVELFQFDDPLASWKTNGEF